jgi:predicted transcriptional regulator
MKKSEFTKQKILDYIKQNPWKSNTQISKNLWLSTVAVLYHLQDLLSMNLIYKIGNTRATRYFLVVKKYKINLDKYFFQRLSLVLWE